MMTTDLSLPVEERAELSVLCATIFGLYFAVYLHEHACRPPCRLLTLLAGSDPDGGRRWLEQPEIAH